MRPTDAARTQRSQRRSPNRRLVGGALVPAAAIAGSLGATAAAAAAAQSQSVVTTAKIAGLGTVLEASHRPLYEMANDPKGHAACTGACAKIWKPLIVSHKAAHHLGHVSGLGTIHRSNELQVAIHGHGLFFYKSDHSQSHAGGQGFANNWFTVKSNGTLNRTSTKNSSSAPMQTVPTTSKPGTPTTSKPGSNPSSPTTTRPTSAPASPAPNIPAPNSPPPTSPPPTSPPPTTPPTTSPPPPPPTTTVPPTTTTTTSGGGGGVGF